MTVSLFPLSLYRVLYLCYTVERMVKKKMIAHDDLKRLMLEKCAKLGGQAI